MTKDEKAARLRQAYYILTPNTGRSWSECSENEKDHWRSVVDEADKIAAAVKNLSPPVLPLKVEGHMPKFHALHEHCECSDCSTTELCKQSDVTIYFDGEYFRAWCQVCNAQYLLGWLER